MIETIRNLFEPSPIVKSFWVALISGLLVRYVGNGIDKVLSLIFKRYRQSRKQRMEKREKYIVSISNDPTSLIIEHIRSAYSSLLSFIMIGVSIIILKNPELFGRVIENNAKLSGLIVLGGFSLGIWFSDIRRWLTVCRKARKLYISRLNKQGKSE
jgi:hypothetical protein